jgi:hypothetical protein
VKKLIALLVLGALVIGGAVGCGGSTTSKPATPATTPKAG